MYETLPPPSLTQPFLGVFTEREKEGKSKALIRASLVFRDKGKKPAVSKTGRRKKGEKKMWLPGWLAGTAGGCHRSSWADGFPQSPFCCTQLLKPKVKQNTPKPVWSSQRSLQTFLAGGLRWWWLYILYTYICVLEYIKPAVAGASNHNWILLSKFKWN